MVPKFANIILLLDFNILATLRFNKTVDVLSSHFKYEIIHIFINFKMI